ncbi:MFS transporter, partial [Sphingopyxis sp. RIFCSPHIGHO2_12_FULL_65_19]|uniref:MFS transporter n=1 Tax=Sphingopyxis sp. RIFCSPHIGHO2_12_FULL_65_19 TaxID=1802172 RepID=UPI0025E31205
DLIPRDAARCGRNRSAFLFAMVNLMAKFGVAAAIAVSYAALDVVGFDPQDGSAAARELHLIFALQPTASWIVMVGLLLLMRRELGRSSALAPALAIAAPHK